MSPRSLLQRHPLAVYYIFVLGWIGLFTLLAYRFIPPDMPNGLGSVPVWLMLVLMFGMPSVIGLGLTALGEGKSGVKALLARLGQWRVNPGLYAAAVLIPIVIYGISLVLQHGLGGPALDIRLSALAAGVGSGLFSCLFEELGWRGYVLPRLLRRHSVFKAGLLTGLGWGAWHFMLNYIGMRQYGAWMPLLSFLLGPLVLTGFALLMTSLYVRARGSLLVMALFHLSITANSIFLSIAAPTLSEYLRQAVVMCVVVWLAVAVSALLGGFRAAQPDSQAAKAASSPIKA
jgi:uncharacterized protein